MVGREVSPVVEAWPLAPFTRAPTLPLGGRWQVLSNQVPNRHLTHASPDVLLAADRQHIALLACFQKPPQATIIAIDRMAHQPPRLYPMVEVPAQHDFS